MLVAQLPPERHDTRKNRLAITIVFVIAVLGAVNWALSPERAGRWLRAMLMLPTMWTALILCRFWMLRSLKRRGLDDDSAVRGYFGSVVAMLFVAVGIQQIVRLGLEIWVEFAGREDLDLERRILGLATSAVFIVVGNTLPKILTPLSILPPEASVRQSAARRFIGLSWVLLGSTTALAFVFTPLAFAVTLGRWTAAGGLLTILTGIVWMNLGPAIREG